MLRGDVEDSRSFRTAHPLVAVGRQEGDLRFSNIDGQRADTLNGVDAKENASLRDAISDAWQTYNTCREALTEAQAQVQELATQNHMLSQYLIDTSEGFECLPGCNSNGHETMCPVSNPLVAWRLIRSQLQEVTSRLNQARAEVKELRRLIDDPDPTAV